MTFSPRFGAARAFTLRAEDLIEVDGCLFHPVDQSEKGVFLISTNGLFGQTVPWSRLFNLYLDDERRCHLSPAKSGRGTQTEQNDNALDPVPGNDDHTSRRLSPHACASHGRLGHGRSSRSRKCSRPGNAEPLLSRATREDFADRSSGCAGKTGHRRYRLSRLYVDTVLARHGRRRSIWGRPRLR